MSINKTRSSTIYLNELITNIPVRRKIVDHNDRDKFEWNQWQSATKAINNIEVSPKEKHIRNLILGTFRLEGSRLFWSMMIRINIESHPIICWKFCYVIHRLLRDGHKNVIRDSILLTSYFDQLSKYWSCIQQNYGLLSYHYCNLIISKLKFHERNLMFTGNLTINEHNDIRCLFNNNFNSYFQLCIELFNYMEEILNLAQIIFKSLDQSRLNSMTTTGQCRLNPLIICIQDSSLLYDYIVKVLFKLHENLSVGDTLQNHRQKLFDQFQRLKSFYAQSSTLPYFRNLIKIPILPENPPNFNVKESLANYQTPMAIVNTSASDSSQMIQDLLIDISDDTKSTSIATLSDNLLENETIYNRSQNIVDFDQELLQVNKVQQNRSEIDDLHRMIAMKDAELIAERNHRLQIEEQLRYQLNNQQSIEEIYALDNKTNSNEKFNKLFDTYNQLHEEHIVVLHREGEIKKQFENLNQQYIQLKEDYQELQDRIQILTNERNDYQSITITTNERIKEIELSKQSFEERLKELENDKSCLHNDKFNFEQKLKETEGERRDLFDQNREQEENLIDLIHEKEVLEQKVIDLEETIREWARKFIDIADKQKLIQVNHENFLKNLKRQYKYSILTYCINQMHDGIDRTKDIELFNSDTLSFLNECITLANCMADIVVHGKAVANLVQDVIVANDYRDITLYCIDLYTNYQTSSTSDDIDKQSNQLIYRLNLLIEKTKRFSA
ncbi:unnamed protein product [Rotaria sp. Silwood1]|nr:unnamed protein product [Rotaria sp. Silwood1]